MIPRSLPNQVIPIASTSASGPTLPGLVSSLRPIKRLGNQLKDEATLLSRFTYKNKNQHKGNGWWRRVVEVDRVIHRLVAEVGELLDQFGIHVDSKQDIGLVSDRAVVPGLVRLPRASALVDKTLATLLSSSSILEQLVESRAFLAFALVVVALISRLHAVTTVLAEELAKTATVLVRLVNANQLLPVLTASIKPLPRQLRRFIPLNPPLPTPATAPSTRQSLPVPPARHGPVANDLGALISRDQLIRHRPAPPPCVSRSPRGKAASSTLARAPAPTEAPETEVAARQKRAEREEDGRVRRAGGRNDGPGGGEVGPTSGADRAAASPASGEWSVLPPPAAVPPPPQESVKKKKKKRVEGGADGDGDGDGPVPIKKKKKKRIPNMDDEIDDIFG